jgi:hypothetical protein
MPRIVEILRPELSAIGGQLLDGALGQFLVSNAPG